MPAHNWKLSPSDFAFLWEECKRCFYLKVAKGFQRPSAPMPKIFTTIDAEMKSWFAGKRTEEFAKALPAGIVKYSDQWVESKPIVLPAHSSSCYIRGKLDTVIEFDRGGYAVIDFKTSETKAEHIPLYGRQLHAYAYALEKAASGKFGLKPVERLGLLVFEPNAFTHVRDGKASLSGTMSWVEIPRNDKQFLQFLGEVVDILEQRSPPAAAPKCGWCVYREASRQTGL